MAGSRAPIAAPVGERLSQQGVRRAQPATAMDRGTDGPPTALSASAPGLHLLRLSQTMLCLRTLRLHQQRGFKLVFRVFRIFEAEVNLAEQESCRELAGSEFQAGF